MVDFIDHDKFSVTVDKVRKGDVILLGAADDSDIGSAWYLVQEEWNGGIYGPDHYGTHLVRVISHMHESPYQLMEPGDEYGNGGTYDHDMLIDHWIKDGERVTIRTPYNQVPAMTSDGELIRWWVNVYEVGQGYGGPEEGGWWFDTGELKATVPCGTYEKAEAAAELMRKMWENESDYPTYSVLYSGGNYRVVIEDHEGRDFPVHTPHYS